MAEPIHEYAQDITVADVRAAVADVQLDTEAPGYVPLPEGVKGLLERLAVSAGNYDRAPTDRLAWVPADG
jgi:hypothetical protein